MFLNSCMIHCGHFVTTCRSERTFRKHESNLLKAGDCFIWFAWRLLNNHLIRQARLYALAVKHMFQLLDVDVLLAQL